VPLSTNLTAYYRMEDASGNATDEVAAATLTANNTVTSTTGNVGNCRRFTAASSENFTRTDDATFSMGDIDFTFAFWLKSRANPFHNRPILLKGNGSNADYILMLNSGERPRWEVYGSASFGNGTTITGAELFDTNWHLIVCGHDAANDVIFYSFDGAAKTTSAHTFGVRDGGEDFVVGGGNGFNYADVDLDELALWKNRVLSDSDITELYNSGAGRDYAYVSGGAAANRRRRVLLCGGC
jgi:hypothetical protein